MWQTLTQGIASRPCESPTNYPITYVDHKQPSMHIFSLVALMLSCPPPFQTRPSNCRCQGSKAPVARDRHHSVGQKLPRNETQPEDPTAMELWSTSTHESETRLIPRKTQIEAGISCS